MKKPSKVSLIAGTAKFLAALLILHLSAPVQPGQRKVTRTNTTRVERDSKLKDEIKQTTRLPFISDVRVIPSASNAVISFKSSQRTSPLVEVGRARPAPDRYGVMTFPINTILFTNFVQPQDGRYTLNINVDERTIGGGNELLLHHQRL